MNSKKCYVQPVCFFAALMCLSAPAAFSGDTAPPAKHSYAIKINSQPISLNHRDKNINQVGRLHYLGGLKITSPSYIFGGISGFVVSPGGDQLLGVSDRGLWFMADIRYNGEKLQKLENARMTRMFNSKGKHIYGHASDAEAITDVGGAGFVVSFESHHRLRYFQAHGPQDYASVLSAKAEILTFAPDMKKLLSGQPGNLGVEALTSLQDGRLLALSEGSLKGTDIAEGWIIGRGKVQHVQYELSEGYKPTDMATLPNGDVLVLERRLSLARGLASRLIRIARADIGNKTPLKGKVVAELTFPYNLDNMEALAVRKNEHGDTIIYIMSDNNYNRLQRTLIMMFRLEEEPSPPILTAQK